jgi:hypothetical protein
MAVPIEEVLNVLRERGIDPAEQSERTETLQASAKSRRRKRSMPHRSMRFFVKTEMFSIRTMADWATGGAKLQTSSLLNKGFLI